jgi:hypothetical protein
LPVGTEPVPNGLTDLDKGDQSEKPQFPKVSPGLIEHLKDRPDLPVGGSFHDNIEKCLSLLVPCQIGFNVEMNGSPVPPL